MASGTITAGKNIRFLLGSQDNLKPYIQGSSTAAEGTFYLTQDTHRLYIGTKEGRAVPVNEGVITVADLTELNSHTSVANPGEFYYVTDGNILCVYAGAAGWVQINNNSNTYLTDTDTEISLAGKVATITTKYTDNTGNKDLTNALTDSWEFEVAAGLTIAVNGDKITLNAAEIDEFSAAASGDTATVTLTDTFDKTADFNIKTGSTATMTVAAEGKDVTLTVKDMFNKSVAVAPDATDADKKGFRVSVTDMGGTVSGTFDPQIAVGAGDDATKHKTVSFKDGTATLPVYTKDEIDNIKLALNAMTYRGLVANSASGSSIKAWSAVKGAAAEIGDTYLFAEKVTDGNNTYSKGTLAIARGQETNGVIAAGNVIWDFVESTVDTDTKYELNNSATTAAKNDGFVQLIGKVGGTTESGKKVYFQNGTEIVADVSVDASGDAFVKFSHEGHTATPTNNTKAQDKAVYSSSDNAALKETKITAIESIVVNAQGHVTGITTNEITLRDTNAVINKVGMTVGAATNANSVALTSAVQLKDGAGTAMTEKTGSWNIKSETLVFNQKDSGASLGIDLVWGSF